jgi:oleandomycin transport system ATP-binding protein
MSKAVEVRGLSYRYPGGRGITGITFDAGAGGVVCIFGWNCAGKTTLLKVLSNIAAPQAGTCFVCGYEVSWDRGPVRRIHVDASFREDIITRSGALS